MSLVKLVNLVKLLSLVKLVSLLITVMIMTLSVVVITEGTEYLALLGDWFADYSNFLQCCKKSSQTTFPDCDLWRCTTRQSSITTLLHLTELVVVFFSSNFPWAPYWILIFSVTVHTAKQDPLKANNSWLGLSNFFLAHVLGLISTWVSGPLIQVPGKWRSYQIITSPTHTPKSDNL